MIINNVFVVKGKTIKSRDCALANDLVKSGGIWYVELVSHGAATLRVVGAPEGYRFGASNRVA